MAFDVPPPFTDQIRGMAPGTDLFIPDAKPTSIAVLACRIGKKLGRQYRTREEDGGVRIWRLEQRIKAYGD